MPEVPLFPRLPTCLLLLAGCAGDGGDSTAGEDTAAAPFTPAEGCPAAEPGVQEVTDGAGPYRVMHPLEDDHAGPTVLFLPGGPGDEGSANATWSAFFDADPRGYRIVMPWDTTGDYPNTAPPVEAILDEVAACFGGDPGRVHLAGHSNGGYLAYNVVGPDLAERFVTVTGAPAYFTMLRESRLAGLAFHNSAGDQDEDWLAEMESAHEELTDAGFESELTVWTETGHTPGPGWDGRDAMFDFWDRHSE